MSTFSSLSPSLYILRTLQTMSPLLTIFSSFFIFWSSILSMTSPTHTFPFLFLLFMQLSIQPQKLSILRFSSSNLYPPYILFLFCFYSLSIFLFFIFSISSQNFSWTLTWSPSKFLLISFLSPLSNKIGNKAGAAYDEYQGMKGDKVYLACNSSHWYENSVSLVLWYREFSDVPIYTLDVRESLSKSHHIKSPAYKDRTFFDVSVNPPRLVLDNVTKADEGLFRCRVSIQFDTIKEHPLHYYTNSSFNPFYPFFRFTSLFNVPTSGFVWLRVPQMSVPDMICPLFFDQLCPLLFPLIFTFISLSFSFCFYSSYRSASESIHSTLFIIHFFVLFSGHFHPFPSFITHTNNNRIVECPASSFSILTVKFTQSFSLSLTIQIHLK